MALKTSLVIAGDPAGATAALDQVNQGLAQTGSAGADAGVSISSAMTKALDAIVENTGATSQLVAALVAGTSAARDKAAAANSMAQAERAAAMAANDNAKAQASLAQQASALRAALDPMYVAQQRFNEALDSAEALLRESMITEREYASAIELARQQLQSHAAAVTANSSALDASTGRTKAAQAGYVNLGRQMQDVAVELQGGINIGTIVAQQGGQIADAVAQMGGRFSGLAAFLAGPWGAAIIVGTGVLLNFAEKLWQSGDAADKTKSKTYDFAAGLDILTLHADQATDAMKQLADATKSAIKVQGDLLSVLSQTSNASVASLEQRIAANQAELSSLKAQSDSWSSRLIGDWGGDWKRMVDLTASLASDRAALASAKEAQTNAELATSQRKVADALDARTAATDRYNEAVGRLNAQYKASKSDPVGSASSGQFITQADYERQLTQITRTRDAALEAAKEARKKPHQKTDPTISANKFEADAGTSIERLTNQYAELPSAVEKANASLLELDKIQASIVARAKQKGGQVIDVDGLSASAAIAREAIENSLTKPFRDYVKAQAEAAQIDNLMIAGREDEANALKVILGLQKQQRPLTAEQADQVLAIVQAERQRALVLRDQKALLQVNVAQVTTMRTALNQTVADALKGRFSFSTVLSSAANAYINSLSQQIVENLVGKSLRSLEDEASQPFAKALKTGETAASSFADAVVAATARINGSTSSSTASAASPGPGYDWTADGGWVKTSAADDGITVVGRKSKSSGLDGSTTSTLANSMATALKGLLGIELPRSLIDGMTPLFKGLEKALPDAFHGAMTGSAVSSLVLGSGSNSVGSGIGGAIGEVAGKKFLTAGLDFVSKGLGSFAGPLGSAVGGVLGGLLGGLFAPTKAGTVVINSGKSSQTASTAEVAQGLTTISTSIQSTLDQIAKQFSTSVGNYSVSIGQYKDYYRVSASGSDHVGDKYYPNTANGDNLYDGTSQSQAVLIAIQNAIQDGAIKGLSAAVQKALGSSSDVEKAMAEALKVQDLELALGGVQASLEKEFRTFENTAEDRVALAKKYGFDLVKVEELNNKERLDLSKKLLKDQVGSLQDLIDQMTSGSLFEGTLVDKRAAILTKIDAAKAAVAAGESGAADTLAQLLSDLASASKDAYGTTGAYASDRTLITDTAQQTIAAANAAITAAEAATTSSSSSSGTTDQLNEANDQLAKIATYLGMSVDYLKSIASSSDSGTLATLKQQASY